MFYFILKPLGWRLIIKGHFYLEALFSFYNWLKLQVHSRACLLKGSLIMFPRVLGCCLSLRGVGSNVMLCRASILFIVEIDSLEGAESSRKS